MVFLEALLSLILILICAELFTNGVEVFGEKLSLSQAVVGSVLAAIGTALPETIVPLVAILFYKGDAGDQIGIGAILGAPFMLVTAGLFLVATGVLISYLRGNRTLEIKIEPHTFQRDFIFFIISYSIAIFIPLLFTNNKFLYFLLAFILVINYLIYLFLTFRSDSITVEAYKDLYLEKFLKKVRITVNNTGVIFIALIQCICAVIVMIKSAHIFVESLEALSKVFGISPILFSLIVAPIATELPEKFNSLIWTLRGRDVLALGNMTGAMVFQSTFPVSIGLIFTSWNLEGLALVSAFIAIGLALFYLLCIFLFRKLSPFILLLSGLAYFVYIYFVVTLK